MGYVPFLVVSSVYRFLNLKAPVSLMSAKIDASSALSATSSLKKLTVRDPQSTAVALVTMVPMSHGWSIRGFLRV